VHSENDRRPQLRERVRAPIVGHNAEESLGRYTRISARGIPDLVSFIAMGRLVRCSRACLCRLEANEAIRDVRKANHQGTLQTYACDTV
jgi:hypothetical protein